MSTRSSVRSRNRESKKLLDRMASDEQLAKGSTHIFVLFRFIFTCIIRIWYRAEDLFTSRFRNFCSSAHILFLIENILVFCAGCFALPLLWIANLWYFRNKIFDDQASIILRRWLHLSLIGSFAAVIGLISWITYFQITINSWDENFLVYIYSPPHNTTNSTLPIIDHMLH